MKKIYLFILMIAAGILAGCVRENIPSGTDEIAIRASIGNMSKVFYEGNATSFTSGDKLILYSWMGNASEIPTERVVDGVVNTFDGSKWTPDTKMIWKNMTGAHYFLGISPVPASITKFSDVDFVVDPDNYTASDLLLATNLGGVTGKNGLVDLKFDHAMAKLIVNLRFRSEWDAVPALTGITTVAKKAAKVNYLTKAVAADGEAAEMVIPAASAPIGNILPCICIMVPQTGVRKINFVIGGREFFFEAAEDIPLKANKYTALDLAIGKEKIEYTSISVKDWDTGTDITGGGAEVNSTPEFALAIPTDDALFRGISNVCVIPFDSEPGANSTKIGDIFHPGGFYGPYDQSATNYLVSTNQLPPVGTKNVLFYAKDPAYNGDLDITGLADDEFTTPGNILFSPKRINTSSEPQAGNAVGQNIITLLNNLANASVSGVASPEDRWSTTTHAVLSKLYPLFISMTSASSYSISVILNQIYYAMEAVGSTDAAKPLANNIQDMIRDVFASYYIPVDGMPIELNSDYAGYPGNIGLPDGAARIKWVSSGSGNGNFVNDNTADYSGVLQAGLTDYVYPAAVYYYANTPLKASPRNNCYLFEEATDWTDALNRFYAEADDVVGEKTRSVVLTKPVRNSACYLDIKINMESGPFSDAKGKSISTGSGYTLKGILIGGQSSVAYDFSPKGAEALIAYNKNIPSGTIVTPGDTTGVVRTTLLGDGYSPGVVLELVNGGETFAGSDGVIPAGGTFYLPFNPGGALIKKGEAISVLLTIDSGTSLAAAMGGVPDLRIPYHYGHQYVDMGDGLKWATCNVGADNPWDYGGYYAWGETAPKAEYSWGTYKWIKNGQTSWKYITKYTFADGQSDGTWWYDGDTFKGDNGDGAEHKDFASYNYADDAARQNWGGSWRTPTGAEWVWLHTNCTWNWQTDYNGTGVTGMLVTSNINGNVIFLPAAGYWGDPDYYYDGEAGEYWSSSLYDTNLQYAKYTHFTLSWVCGDGGKRFAGLSIRPVTQ